MVSIASLAGSARHVIQQSHENTFQYVHAHGYASGPQEPDFVATLVRDGVSALHRRWSIALGPQLPIKVAGLFVHQSPMVEFRRQGQPQRCELGDLLLVIRKTSGDGFATLFQAKMAPASVATLPNGPQRTLYKHWPPFIVPVWQRKEFDVGIGAGQGVLAGVRGTRLPPPRPFASDAWHVQDVFRPGPRRGLAHYWAGLFYGQQGRRFRYPAPAGDDWSRLIEALLDETAYRLFNRRNAGMSGVPRGVSLYLSHDRVSRFGSDSDFFVAGDVNEPLVPMASEGPPPTVREQASEGGRGFGIIVTDIGGAPEG